MNDWTGFSHHSDTEKRFIMEMSPQKIEQFLGSQYTSFPVPEDKLRLRLLTKYNPDDCGERKLAERRKVFNLLTYSGNVASAQPSILFRGGRIISLPLAS